jgi:hypothetical protein
LFVLRPGKRWEGNYAIIVSASYSTLPALVSCVYLFPAFNSRQTLSCFPQYFVLSRLLPPPFRLLPSLCDADEHNKTCYRYASLIYSFLFENKNSFVFPNYTPFKVKYSSVGRRFDLNASLMWHSIGSILERDKQLSERTFTKIPVLSSK